MSNAVGNDAFFIARTHPEREKKPRQSAAVIKLPAPLFEPGIGEVNNIVALWRDTMGVRLDREHIYQHMERLRQWQIRPMKKSRRI